MNFDDLRQIALSFPGVEEYVTFGSPAFRIRKRYLAGIAKVSPDALIIKVPDKSEREFLLKTKPEIFYTTDHYEGFDSILVRMSVADPQEVRELIEDAWRTFAPKRVVAAYDQDNGSQKPN